MNNKIKEKMTIGKAEKILRGFLEKDCYYDTPLYYAIPYLLDYITNLQQENKKIQQQHLETINKLIETQERIEKAIEYIKVRNFDEVSIAPFDDDFNCKENLLNILNGRSDE